MNIRNLKLALTVDLMNRPSSESPVHFAVEKMDQFHHLTGDLQESVEMNKSFLGDNMEWKTMALRFEHYTLNLDVISDVENREEHIQNFHLIAN